MDWTQVFTGLVSVAAPVAITTFIGLTITGLWKLAGWIADHVLKRRRNVRMAEAMAFGETLRDPDASPSDRARARSEIRLRGFTVDDVETEITYRNWMWASEALYTLSFPVGDPFREWLETRKLSSLERWLHSPEERRIRFEVMAVLFGVIFAAFMVLHVRIALF